MCCLFAGAACSVHLIPSGWKNLTPTEHCMILTVLLCHYFEAHHKKKRALPCQFGLPPSLAAPASPVKVQITTATTRHCSCQLPFLWWYVRGHPEE